MCEVCDQEGIHRGYVRYVIRRVSIEGDQEGIHRGCVRYVIRRVSIEDV